MRLFHLNMKEYRHALIGAVFWWKRKKDFSIQKRIDSQSEKSGDGWCRTKHNRLQNFTAAKLKVNFFVLLRVALVVSQVTLSA